MSKIHFVDQSRRGIVIASIFKKNRGALSIAFNGQIKKDGKYITAPKGKKLVEVMYGDNMYAVPNNRKKEGDKLPDFIVYAYPEEDEAESEKDEAESEEDKA